MAFDVFDVFAAFDVFDVFDVFAVFDVFDAFDAFDPTIISAPPVCRFLKLLSVETGHITLSQRGNQHYLWKRGT